MANTKINVLLVEDDEVTNALNVYILRDHDWLNRIDICNNGKEAIDYILKHCLENHNNLVGTAESNVTHLIFVDLHMPVMDGFDFLAELEKIRGKYSSYIAHVVVLTSSWSRKDVLKACQYPLLNFLEKPLNYEKLKLLYTDLSIKLESE